MRIASKVPTATLAMGLALIAVEASPSRAGVILTGQIIQISAPTSDVPNSDPTSNTHAFIWSERSGVVLSTSVTVDMTMPGTSDSGNNFQPSPGTVASGTMVDTYLIHSDPIGSNVAHYVASVTFDTKILGIVDTISGLAATDSTLGSPTTTYPGVIPFRGLELTDQLAWVSNNGLTLNFTTEAAVDEVRVLVAAASIPEPSTLTMCGLGGSFALAFGWFRKSRGPVVA